MTLDFITGRYRDWSDRYTAKMKTYRMGMSMMMCCADRGYTVEPMNLLAYAQYVKLLEKFDLLPQIDWIRYHRRLVEERVLCYQAMHRDVVDGTLHFAVAQPHMRSLFISWQQHEFDETNEMFSVGRKAYETPFGEEWPTQQSSFVVSKSQRAALADRLFALYGLQPKEVPLDDGNAFCQLLDCRDNADMVRWKKNPFGLWGWPGAGTASVRRLLSEAGMIGGGERKTVLTKDFDTLVTLTGWMLKRTHGFGLTRMAESVYEAWLAYTFAYFRAMDADTFDQCAMECFADARRMDYFD